MYTRNEKIIPIYIEDEMRDSYITYAMSVIVGRALPDVRDGLKPVHRRILYAMKELALEANKPYKKSARIVGEVLGKYHPHGDSAVYDALVRMVQDFSLRYPLVDGQGNFGSIDGDSAAAMRYTEARMARPSQLILEDIDKETVDFVPNFDESLQEPTVMPGMLPNLLVNGSGGIAVGMATNIPPQNLTEVVKGICHLIDNPDCTVKDLMRFVKGPDFPTGALISGREGIKSAYETGRGSIKVRAKAHIETQKNNRQSIIITAIPYQVNKANLIESIANLVQTKKIDGISDIRDESDRDGLRVVIDLKRDVIADVVLNQLYKHTQMRTSFGVIMLALVDNRPKILTLKGMMEEYLRHRKQIIIRRTQFELDKARRRAHILEGFKIAIKFLDEVIRLIRRSKTPQEAKDGLMQRFKLSDVQSQAILEMQLQRLTALERDKIDNEYLELIKRIEYLESILKSEAKILQIIKTELEELNEKFGDARRTEIVADAGEFSIEDLIAEEDVVITVSHAGYVKRLPVSAYRKQNRGGVGISGAGTKEDDFIESLSIASTHDYMLIFTTTGKLHWIKVHEIPHAGRTSRGKAIVNFLQLEGNEKIASYLAIREFAEDRYVVMATSMGVIKKTPLAAFANPRKGGIIAMTLEKEEELIGVEITDGDQDLMLCTQDGRAIRFHETDVRSMGRSARGVRGIVVGKKEKVIALEVVQSDQSLLTVTSGGLGKRTKLSQYRVQTRGGKGITNIKLAAKSGLVTGLAMVTDEDEILAMTSGGMIVRMSVSDIRTSGRSTQGVRVMRLKEGDRITGIAKLPVAGTEPDQLNGAVIQTETPAVHAELPGDLEEEPDDLEDAGAGALDAGSEPEPAKKKATAKKSPAAKKVVKKAAPKKAPAPKAVKKKSSKKKSR